MYRLGSIISILISAVFGYQAYSLGLGSTTNPGPGFWPFILCAVILVASLLSLLFEKDPRQYEGFSKNARFTLYAVISLAVFIVLFDWIGFLLSSFLLLIFWFRFLGKESWRLTILSSIIITIGFYMLFAIWLKIPFPEDLLLQFETGG